MHMKVEFADGFGTAGHVSKESMSKYCLVLPSSGVSGRYIKSKISHIIAKVSSFCININVDGWHHASHAHNLTLSDLPPAFHFPLP